jgi:hypothetical protein
VIRPQHRCRTLRLGSAPRRSPATIADRSSTARSAPPACSTHVTASA